MSGHRAAGPCPVGLQPLQRTSAAGPKEQEELSQSEAHRDLFDTFLAEAKAKWDIPAIHHQVLASQRRRRFVAESLALGKLKSWDHQPLVDASQQYMRNHIDLDDLERKARYPQP